MQHQREEEDGRGENESNTVSSLQRALSSTSSSLQNALASLHVPDTGGNSKDYEDDTDHDAIHSSSSDGRSGPCRLNYDLEDEDDAVLAVTTPTKSTPSSKSSSLQKEMRKINGYKFLEQYDREARRRGKDDVWFRFLAKY